MDEQSRLRMRTLLELIEPELDALPDLPLPPPPAPDAETAETETAEPETAAISGNPSSTNTTPGTRDELEPRAGARRVEGESLPDDLQEEQEEQEAEAADLEEGQVGPHDQSYCPILPVSKFPYKFIHGSESQPVAERFFDQGKFWKRKWHLYCVQHPDSLQQVIFIPESQLLALLREINKAFRLNLSITPSLRELGLSIRFPPHPDTLPRYLGRSTSRDDFDSMKDQVPRLFARPVGIERASPEDVAAFKLKIEESIALNKAKKKGAQEKRRKDVLQQHKMLGQQLKRAQRYLGLRPKKSKDDDDDNAAASDEKANSTLPSVNVDLTVPWPFELAPVFICVDVEAYEFDHRVITEIGIATLDTLTLATTPPGRGACDWFPKIRARHLRVTEYSHMENRVHVQGCANHFDFGTSEFVRLSELKRVVKEAFQPPYSCPPEHLSSKNDAPRNIVLVGHDTLTDIKYLVKVGYNPLDLPTANIAPDGTTTSPGLVEVLDTSILYQSYGREPNQRSLGYILSQVDIAGWNVHNGGNDAVYTMQAMLAMVVNDAAARRGEDRAAREKQLDEARQRTVEERVKDVKEDVARDGEGWSGDEDDDGGVGALPAYGDLKLRGGAAAEDAGAGEKKLRFPPDVYAAWKADGRPKCPEGVRHPPGYCSQVHPVTPAPRQDAGKDVVGGPVVMPPVAGQSILFPKDAWDSWRRDGYVPCEEGHAHPPGFCDVVHPNERRRVEAEEALGESSWLRTSMEAGKSNSGHVPPGDESKGTSCLVDVSNGKEIGAGAERVGAEGQSKTGQAKREETGGEKASRHARPEVLYPGAVYYAWLADGSPKCALGRTHPPGYCDENLCRERNERDASKAARRGEKGKGKEKAERGDEANLEARHV